jgi:D-xylonolactonase
MSNVDNTLSNIKILATLTKYKDNLAILKSPLNLSIFANSQCEIGEGPFFARNEKSLYYVNPGCINYPNLPGPLIRKSGIGIKDFESFNPNVGTVSAFSQQEDGTFLLFAQGCKVWKWKPNKEAKLFTQLGGNRFKFNDVTTTPDGKVFCTVLPKDLKNGTGELFCLSSDGSFKLLDTCRGIPNGMGFSPDYSNFYFTASSEKTIYRYKYNNNTISSKEILVSNVLCDGLAVDNQGGIWSANWIEKIHRFNPCGKLTLDITIPKYIVSSLCFGGENFSDIYITTANYPYNKENFTKFHAGAVLVWKNSSYQGMKIPFFKGS